MAKAYGRKAAVIAVGLVGLVIVLSPLRLMAGPMDDGNAGLDAMKAGDYDTAIKLFTRAINSRALKGDDLEFAYYQRGVAYLDKHSYGQAKTDLQRAVSLKPDDMDAQAALAEAQQSTAPAPSSVPAASAQSGSRPAAAAPEQAHASAAEDFFKTLGKRLVKDICEDVANQAGTTADCGDDQQAAAAAAPPPHPHTASEDKGAAGMEAMDKGQFQRAVTLFTAAIDANDLIPQEASAAYLNRAKAYYKLGEQRRAVSDVSHALKLEPNDADIQAAFADLMMAYSRAPVLDPAPSDVTCTQAYRSNGSPLGKRQSAITLDYARMQPMDAFVGAFRAASASGWAVTAADSDGGTIEATQLYLDGPRQLIMDVQITPMERGSRTTITVTAGPLMITPDLKGSICKVLADMAS